MTKVYRSPSPSLAQQLEVLSPAMLADRDELRCLKACTRHAAVIYRSAEAWEKLMGEAGWYDASKLTISGASVGFALAVLPSGKRLQMIVIEGTDSLRDVLVDLLFAVKVPWRYFENPASRISYGARRHAEKILEPVLAQVQAFGDDEEDIWITGHSLGGATAGALRFAVLRELYTEASLAISSTHRISLKTVNTSDLESPRYLNKSAGFEDLRSTGPATPHWNLANTLRGTLSWVVRLPRLQWGFVDAGNVAVLSTGVVEQKPARHRPRYRSNFGKGFYQGAGPREELRNLDPWRRHQGVMRLLSRLWFVGRRWAAHSAEKLADDMHWMEPHE